MLLKIDCMNIIVSFEGLSDVSVFLQQNAYEMTSPFADASCCMTFHHTSLQIKPPTSKKFAAVMMFKTTVDGLYNYQFSIHCCCSSQFYSAVCPD